MLFRGGDSQRTQNIQFNKVTGEMKKVSFILQKKTIQTFWPIQYVTSKESHIHFLVN